MDDLKSIWSQVSCETSEFELELNKKTQSIFHKLDEEEILRKKYNPFLAVAIVLFGAFFSYIVFHENGDFSMPNMIGVGLVVLSSIVIATFSQAIKIPLKQFKYDSSSMDFLKTVKNKLSQSKRMLILGVILQVAFLSIGIYLIVFMNTSDINYGILYAYWGFMLGLAGFAIGKSIAFFNYHYSTIYQVINHYTNE